MNKTTAISLAAQIGYQVSTVKEFRALLVSLDEEIQLGLDNKTGDWVLLNMSGEVLARQY